MQKLAEQFRHSTRDRLTSGPPTARYSEEQRQLALRYLRRARKAGGNLSLAAKSLGVDPNTLRTWEKRTQPKPMRAAVSSILPVRVADALGSDHAERPAFVIRGPGNIAIECHSAAGVAEILPLLA